jgi:hypothetical protein
LVLPVSTFACACCAGDGTYSIWTGKPSGYDLEVVNGFEFAQSANLYVTEAEFEAIKGLESLRADFSSDKWSASIDKFDLVGSFTKSIWTLNFVTVSGKKGSLVLPIPAQMVKFKVDIHDPKTYGAGGPSLYKEFRFKGNVRSGTGMFGGGITPKTTYFLVFQGRGNGCDNSEDFSHWRLEIQGAKARYAFFGRLNSGAADEDPN